MEKKKWSAKSLDPVVVEQVVTFLRQNKQPIHYNDIAKMIGKSQSFVRLILVDMVEKGRRDELSLVRSYIKGTRKPTDFVENLLAHRKSAKPRARPESVCRYCGLTGQLQRLKGGSNRTVCDSCLVDHDLRATNPDHTRTWRDDPRWVAIVARRHQEKGGCLVCGSSRAKERDGRYCDWRHDPVMLTPEEFDALLERHSSVTRYDIWGNVLR